MLSDVSAMGKDLEPFTNVERIRNNTYRIMPVTQHRELHGPGWENGDLEGL